MTNFWTFFLLFNLVVSFSYRVMESSDALDTDTFPCFVVSPRDRRIEYDSSIQFMCKAIGHPTPIVKWYKHGKQLANYGKLWFFSGGFFPIP